MKSVTPRNRHIQQKAISRNHSPIVFAKSKNKENIPPSQKIVKNTYNVEQHLQVLNKVYRGHMISTTLSIFFT